MSHSFGGESRAERASHNHYLVLGG
jgi:hypothetical protein